MAEVQGLTYQDEKLKAELHGHRKARFGSKSEGLEQLALNCQDDQEIEAAADAQYAEHHAGDEGVEGRTKRKHNCAPLPEHLDRQDEVLSPSEESGDCGGSLRQVGEDVTEKLEYIRVAFSCAGSSARAWPAPAVRRSHRLHCHHVR